MFEKILLADDDVDIRSRFYEIFSDLGYKITCIPTGSEVVVRLAEERPQLIILDENMPGLSGFDTAKKIREFDKEVKIVILTEEETSSTEKISKPLNIQGIIKKDFSSHFMLKKVLEILKSGESVKSQDSLIDKSKGKILVVDDNPEVRNVLQRFLSKKGYEISSASSGEQALMDIKSESQKPRIVLLDIRMPGMDGILVLNHIKKLDDSIKVVMLTSAQEEYIMNESIKAGAVDYLIKPCDLNKLDILLTSILLQNKDKESKDGHKNLSSR